MIKPTDKVTLDMGLLVRRVALNLLSPYYDELTSMLRDPQRKFSSIEDEDLVIRAALAIVCGDICMHRKANSEDSSAGVAGSPDDSGSGA